MRLIARTFLFAATLLCIGSFSADAEPVPVTHWDLQAVHPDGTSSFDDNGPQEIVVQGILLNSPEQWLDPTPDSTPGFWQLGGQWQVFIQGENGDHAGTAVWMAQNYGYGPNPPQENNYDETTFISELMRINRDPNTGYIFTPGDRVEVTGRYLFYGGKTNINEHHEADTAYDFTIRLLEPAVGLPEPELVTLVELKDAGDDFIFDETRMTGCEYYQGRRIRINDVSFSDVSGWAPYGLVTITDGVRTFPVRIGLGTGLEDPNSLASTFDVIGIMNQEAPQVSCCPPVLDNTKGYEILVPQYDVNGLVLTDRGYRRGNLQGDVSGDFKVDLGDVAEVAKDWLKLRHGLYEGGE